ncbi:hypothetical protein, partial [Lacticaseibacillus saniviri]|uniref:hypothetical protein n=1 Tax=Lacticaseibacillus saniviri TaxID=931533 RepID=UPI00164D4662
MSSIVGLYHGKRPVLEIRKGSLPLWKSTGWTTPNTNIGLAYSVKVNTYYRGMALPDGRMVYGFLANPANVIESDLSISTLK